MTDAATNPEANAEQIAYWNQIGGPKWVRYQAMLDRQIDPVGTIAMEALGLAPGETVLDVGCGCGSTTLELARRVSPSGRACGLDISRPMLELARERAVRAGLANVTFTEGDAQTFPFRAEYDALFSRFGVMFFDDPARAFANLRAALRKDGRMAFVCWQALPLNPWMAVPVMAAMNHVTIELPTSPDAPGPFAFADSARVRGILEKAGFRDVTLDATSVEIDVGGGASLDDASNFIMNLGPLARSLGGMDETVRDTVARAIREAIKDYAGPSGVRMPGAVWLVQGRA